MSLPKEKISSKYISTNVYDEEFIGLINGLNESIKEYVKVSKHNINETNNFLLLFENHWKDMENLLNEITPEELTEKINEIFIKINESQNLISQLQRNSKSNDTNLNLFFEDAKILFKKMKIKRSQNLNIFKRSISDKKKDSIKDRMIYDINSNSVKNNINTIANINCNNNKKLKYYLNQLKDYNEIIGKFSVKAKFNYMNLQKFIYNIINENYNNIDYISNYQIDVNLTDKIFNGNDTKDKYEKEISNLNNKIKELEKTINENKTKYLQYKKFDQLKKKIELELINSNKNIPTNDNTDNTNSLNQNEFENLILKIIGNNKNSILEINNIKKDINKKNEIIKNLKINNNQLKHDLLDKDNIIQKKENELLILNRENQKYKTKYEDSNILIERLKNNTDIQENINISNYKNNNNNKDSIFELRKEIKKLYNENNLLKNKLNNLKLNMPENEEKIDNINLKGEFLEMNKKDKEINMIKNELDLYKKNLKFNKEKYEKEINILYKKVQDLSKQLTLKTQEIISLQRENIKSKSMLNENYFSNYNDNSIRSKSQTKDINSQTFDKNIDSNINVSMNKLKEENIKLKNIISNHQKEKNSLRNSIVKLNRENKLLSKEIEMQNDQLNILTENTNYKESISILQEELEQLRKMTEENNNKSLQYEQQINELQKLLNEKDELINKYKENIQNIKNNKSNVYMNNNSNEINNLQDLNKNLMKEIELKKREIESLSKSNKKNQNNLMIQYKKKINDLNSSLLKTNSKLEEKDLMIKKLKEKINMNDPNNIGGNNSEQNLNLKIIELENHINELENHNQALTKELMRYNNNNQNHENDKMNNDNSEDNNNDINFLNLKISSLEEENDYYKNKMEELRNQIKNLEKGNNKNNIINNQYFSEINKDNKMREELDLFNKEKMNLEFNINQLNQEISNLNLLNEKLNNDLNEEKNKNNELIKQNSKFNKNNNELFENSKPIYTDNNNNDEDIGIKLQKKEEELEGFKIFLNKLQKNYEKTKDENEEYKLKINSLQKENDSIKKQLERLSITMPKELNALQMQLDEANRKNQQILSGELNNKKNNIQKKNITDRDKYKLKDINDNNLPSDKYNEILLSKLNDANKEISELKNENKKLQFELEEKEVKSAYSGFRTEDVNISNYEEEFDLRKMANRARDKNRSEDINIDYPGIQGLKNKLKELEFKFNILVDQVKILIGNISISLKIKPQITQICQIIGFSPKTTGRIISSTKEKKKLLGI